MKKRYILIILTLFLSLIGRVNAAMGDLRYDVTELKINNNKITFKGWAFIHKTQNFVTVNKMDSNGRETNEVLSVKLSNGYTVTRETTEGGQRIYIRAYYINNRNQKIIIEEKSIEGQKTLDGKKYNFYCQMYFSKESKEECKPSTYNGENSPFPSSPQNINTCELENDEKKWPQCYYEDMGFNITFDVTKGAWQNVPEESEVFFEISATNEDYKEKTNKNRTDYEPLYIRDNVVGNKDNVTDYITIDKTSLSNTVKFIATTAWISDINDLNTSEGRKCMGNTGNTYNLVTNEGITQGFANGYLSTQQNNFPYATYGPGRLLIGTSGISGPINYEICYPGSSLTMAAWSSWVKPTGNISFKIKVKNDKKCTVSEPSDNKAMSCNNWTNLSSTCNELTVRNGNSSATVKIVQNGYISNIFKSNLVNNDKDYDASSYDGGWFKYGIIYYNEVSWESPNLSQDNEKKIEEAMQYRLKDNFEENLNLTINGLYGSRLIKKCNQSGEFKNGEKLVTVCTFFLPDIDAISSTGKISYSKSNDNDNINNKYYIPFNENENEHSVSVILKGLSRLSENQATKDSKVQNKEWFGTWEIDTGCKLKVINRLYNPPGEEGGDGKLKYKFIYRPIDLSNPFPNRFPGVNWYSWYIIEKNKDKKTLEDSYKNLEYYTQLDNKTISEIKKYNKENTYFGEVDEDFFKTYIKEGGNS